MRNRAEMAFSIAVLVATITNCGPGGTGTGTPGTTSAAWNKLNNSSNGMPDYPVRAALVDSSDPSSLYVGTYVNGVYFSTDSGQSWQHNANNLFTTNSRYVRCLLEAGPYLFAGTEDGAHFITKVELLNNGLWTSLTQNILPQNSSIASLCLGPSNRSTPRVFVSSNTGGIHLIEIPLQTGLQWSRTVDATATSALTLRMASDPNKKHLFAGTTGGAVRRYESSGLDSWLVRAGSQSSLNIGQINSLALVDPTNVDTDLLVGAAGGAYRLSWVNSGWQATSLGLNHGSVQLLKISPIHPSILIAESAGQLHRFDGAQWSTLNMQGFSPLPAYDCYLLSPSRIYVGSLNGLWHTDQVGL